MTNVDAASKAYLVIQHLISNTTSITTLRSDLKKFVPIIGKSRANTSESSKTGTTECTISQILEALLVYLPETFSPDDLFSIASELLEDYESVGKTPQDDLDSVFLHFDQKYPQLKYIVGYNEKDLSKRSSDTSKATRVQSNAFDWPVPNSIDDLYALFYYYIKSTIFKINIIVDDLSVIDLAIDKLVKLPYVSNDLISWLNGFYKPVSIISVFCQTPLILVDWSHTSELEKINSIMNLAVDMKQTENIVPKALVPHLIYTIKESSFEYLIDWLQSLGDKKILHNHNATRHQLQEKLQVILEIIREDSLLVSIKKLDDNGKILNQLVNTILSIIYLTPKVSLKIFMTMKEILAIMKTLSLEGEYAIDSDFELPTKTSIKDMSESMPSKPTNSLIKYIEKLVETGERLYANELSLVEVFQLSRESREKQFMELQKFISNETKYVPTEKLQQWQNLLSSIYWIFNNTFVFSKIDTKDLDQMVLCELLNRKLIEVITNVFMNQFMRLDISEFNDTVLREAWKEYNLATNGDVTIGHMSACNNLLKLIDDSASDNSSKVTLLELISVNTILQNYKVYFQTGIPLTPKRISEIDDPIKLITKILELNQEAYKDTDTLFTILCKLIRCLHNDETNNLSDQDELYEYALGSLAKSSPNPLYVKLELLCIDHASVNNDFEYSYNKSVELLETAVQLSPKDKTKELISSQWFTFLQITKNEYYESVSPSPTSSSSLRIDQYQTFNALDMEHLTILMKLDILSKLLLVVPCEFNSNVIDQWMFIHQLQQQYEEESQDTVVDTPHGSESGSNLGSFSNLLNVNNNNKPSSLNSNQKGHLSFQDRLQRSLNSAAFDVFNSPTPPPHSESEGGNHESSSSSSSGGGIGKNIVGWVIGAN